MAPIRTSTTRRRAEINIVNNAELRANAQNILTTIRESRPKNTCEAYEPKQKEFKVGRQARRQAGRQAGRQTGRQANLIGL
jgi:hypothetical protein